MMRGLVSALCGLVLVACVSDGEPKRLGPVDKAAATRFNTELGYGYLKQDKVEVAAEKFARALEHDPNNASASFGYGLTLQRLGRTVEARRAVEHAAKVVKPDNLSLRNDLADWFCQAKSVDQAKLALAPALRRGDTAATLRVSRCYARNGQLAAAESVLLGALRETPESGVLLLGMTAQALAMKDPLRARSFLSRFERVAPATTESSMLGLRIAAQTGDEVARAQYAATLERLAPELAQRVNLKSGEMR